MSAAADAPDAPAQEFGDVLRALRLGRNWSQRQLAHFVGHNERTIRDWEEGRSWPMGSDRPRLKAALDGIDRHFHLLNDLNRLQKVRPRVAIMTPPEALKRPTPPPAPDVDQAPPARSPAPTQGLSLLQIAEIATIAAVPVDYEPPAAPQAPADVGSSPAPDAAVDQAPPAPPAKPPKETDTMQPFTKALVRLIEQRGLTQKEVAEVGGAHFTVASSWVRGASPVPASYGKLIKKYPELRDADAPHYRYPSQAEEVKRLRGEKTAPPSKTKICPGPLCKGKAKPVDAFGPSQASADGLTPVCRECRNANDRERAANREALAAQRDMASAPKGIKTPSAPGADVTFATVGLTELGAKLATAMQAAEEAAKEIAAAEKALAEAKAKGARAAAEVAQCMAQSQSALKALGKGAP